MAEILIPLNDGWVQYTAVGGETSFAYDFPIFDDDHIVVIVTSALGVDTTLVKTTNYTVTDVGDLAGGDVQLITAATAGEIYTIYRDVPEARTTDFQQAGDFKAATVNRELDLVTMMIQELRRDIDRAMALDKASSATISAILPDPQAGLLLGWKSDLTGLENKADIGEQTVSGFMATLLDDSDAAAGRATLDAQQDLDVPSQAEAEAGTATTERVWTAQRVNQAGAKAAIGVLPDFIRGCVPSSAADTAHDITFTSGTCRNAAGTEILTLPAYTKQFDVAFAEGDAAGGFGAALPTSGTYYIFAITKDADGTVDYFGDADSAGANVPSGWTVEREVFRLATDASANLLPFDCYEKAGGALRVQLRTPVLDVDTTIGGPASTLALASIPAGRKVLAQINLYGTVGATLHYYISSPDAVDVVPSSTAAPLSSHPHIVNTAGSPGGFLEVMTNASRQIRARVSHPSTTFRIATLGWIDERI